MLADLFPPEPDFEQIHTRQYEVRTYRMSSDRFLMRGVVVDDKPAGLYIEDDPTPLRMHHMVMELEVSFPAFVIEKASVTYHNYPHTGCDNIVDHYQKLVGLSVMRGFNRKVKDLFGGPHGCTHVTALISAMAPVVIQTAWAMRLIEVRDNPEVVESERTLEQRMQALSGNIDTCHMWDHDGELMDGVRAGDDLEMPLPVQVRLKELGRSLDEWNRFKRV